MHDIACLELCRGTHADVGANIRSTSGAGIVPNALSHAVPAAREVTYTYPSYLLASVH